MLPMSCVAQKVPHQLGLQVNDDVHGHALCWHRIDHELDGALVIEQHQRVLVERSRLLAELEEVLGVEQALVVAFEAR